MIITLIAIALFIVGIACFIIHNEKYRMKFGGDWIWFIGLVSTFISCIALLFVSIAIIDANIKKDINYQNMLHKKEMLEYRIDNMKDNIVGNEMIYNDIVEFNNELRSVKKWANNPWTNWFYVKEIAIIDYVEIDR